MAVAYLRTGMAVAEGMVMRLHHLLAALGAAVLAVSGCADFGASNDEQVVEDSGDGKLDADSRAVIGSWNIIELSSEPNPDVWLALVLKTDKTFYLWPEQGDGFQGTYTLERTTSDPPERFVVLTSETGDELRREYKVEDGALFLRNPSGSWREMEKSERAVCVAVEDCSLQNLRKPACVGSWGCDDDGQCAYTCE